MEIVNLIRKLERFPQDAEVVASDYGLHIYLFPYCDLEIVNGHTLAISPSYDLYAITQDELDNLPWIKDPTWLDIHKREAFESRYPDLFPKIVNYEISKN